MTAWRRAASPEPSRADVLLAVALAAASNVEVWLFWVETEQGPRPLAAAATALMSAALLWRATAPLASALAVAALFATWTSIAAPTGSLAPLLIAMAAAFTVAARCEPRAAVAGGGALLAAVWLMFVLTDDTFANYTFTGVFLVGAWLAGRAVRHREQRAEGFRERALTAERDREARARAAVAEERARIARELHDVVAHSVSTMVIQAQAAQQAAGDDAVVDDALRAIESSGRSALVEMRRLLGLLRRDDEELALAPQPSLRHLDGLVAGVRDAGLPVELRVEGDARPLPPGIDLSAYRIVQEALTNALRHAGPARARIVVRYGERDLELEVSDDGAGMQAARGAAPSGTGHGLVGMRERISVYGGVLETGPRPDGGYALRVRLPLDSARG